MPSSLLTARIAAEVFWLRKHCVPSVGSGDLTFLQTRVDSWPTGGSVGHTFSVLGNGSGWACVSPYVLSDLINMLMPTQVHNPFLQLNNSAFTLAKALENSDVHSVCKRYLP